MKNNSLNIAGLCLLTSLALASCKKEDLKTTPNQPQASGQQPKNSGALQRDIEPKSTTIYGTYDSRGPLWWCFGHKGTCITIIYRNVYQPNPTRFVYSGDPNDPGSKVIVDKYDPTGNLVATDEYIEVEQTLEQNGSSSFIGTP